MNVWRHARPVGADGRCVGRTDLPVDRRKSKRLAHRIRTWARRHRLPRVVITSPLQRGADTGRWLARWGWCHRVDARLCELDFGAWEGRAWADIPLARIDAWCADFQNGRPGGGESVSSLLARCAEFLAEAPAGSIVVGHAGWISAACWLQDSQRREPDAASWPKAFGYGTSIALKFN